MIFANGAVAQRIASVFPLAALLRHHPLPKEEHFAELKRVAALKGFDIDTTYSTLRFQHTDSILTDRTSPWRDLWTIATTLQTPTLTLSLGRLFVFLCLLTSHRMLTTQAMSEAAYFSTGSIDADNWFHYGLGLSFYTHFTSPIRRYVGHAC